MKTKKEPLKETEKKNLKGGPLGRILESSGGSSGIGSDHPPSPDQNGRYLDNQSTSGKRFRYLFFADFLTEKKTKNFKFKLLNDSEW